MPVAAHVPRRPAWPAELYAARESGNPRRRPPEGRDSHGERHPGGWRFRVGAWGMSDVIGPVTLINEEGHVPLSGASDVSTQTRQLVDDEVRHMIEQAHEQVTQLMSARRTQLDALATALLQRETLEQDEVYAAAGIDLADKSGAWRPGESSQPKPQGSPA